MNRVDGARVHYVGEPGEGLPEVGTPGRIMLAAKGASHVQWLDGESKGEIQLIENDDFVVAQRKQADDPIQDSLEDGVFVTVAVRETYDLDGEDGLLSALSESGHLSSLAVVGEEVFEYVAGRVRQDASMREVLAQLDSDEGDALVTRATTSLLRDAIRN